MRIALPIALAALLAAPPAAQASSPAQAPPRILGVNTSAAARRSTATAAGLPVVNLANVAALDLSRLPATPDGRRMVAKVNGRAVLEANFLAMLQTSVAQQSPTDPQRAKALEQVLAPQVLDRLVLAEVMKDYASGARIRVSESEVDRAIEQANRELPGGRKMEDAIVQGRQTRESLRETVRIQLLERKVADHVTSSVVVTDKETTAPNEPAPEPALEEADPSHPRPAPVLPKEFRVSCVYTRYAADAPASATQAARARAEAALAQVRGGMDFAEAARQFSEDPRSAARDGDIGYIASGSAAPQLLRAASALEPGDVSEVIAVPGGFCVLKLIERHDGTTHTEAQRAMRTRAFQDWCSRALKAAKIERYL